MRRDYKRMYVVLNDIFLCESQTHRILEIIWESVEKFIGGSSAQKLRLHIELEV